MVQDASPATTVTHLQRRIEDKDGAPATTGTHPQRRIEDKDAAPATTVTGPATPPARDTDTSEDRPLESASPAQLLAQRSTGNVLTKTKKSPKNTEKKVAKTQTVAVSNKNKLKVSQRSTTRNTTAKNLLVSNRSPARASPLKKPPADPPHASPLKPPADPPRASPWKPPPAAEERHGHESLEKTPALGGATRSGGERTAALMAPKAVAPAAPAAPAPATKPRPQRRSEYPTADIRTLAEWKRAHG